jgi:Amt family ammonium transporter
MMNGRTAIWLYFPLINSSFIVHRFSHMRPILLVIFGIGSLLLRAGFALQASGSLRAKNSASAVLRITADTAAAALAFWAFGAGILFQTHNGWLGFDGGFLFREPPNVASTEFFHLTLCIIGGAIVTGAIAERAKFYVGFTASAVLGGIVFPIAGHWIWFGQLQIWGLHFIDFGGATAIHLTGATFGAIGIAVVGSRAGKYNRDGSSSSIPGHSLPMLGIGSLLLFAGWFPYLIGCLVAHWPADSTVSDIALGIAATNIMLAAAAGVAGGLIYSQFRYGKPDLFFTYGGLIGGLVAISSGIAVVPGYGAIAIGLVAGILVPIVSLELDLTAKLDDPIGVIAIHGVGAIWGTLATAIFIPLSDFSDHFKLLAVQCGGLAMVIALSAIVAGVMFVILKKLGAMRVVDADEFDGLDIGEHDINSYPDFQQTTIKSYHTREA